jgi:hypothetical protein
MMKNKATVIGIDPDVSRSGVAVATDGRIESLECLCFTDLCNFLSTLPPSAIVAIEDVEHDKTTYPRKANKAAMLKIAQNVGMAKATCRHIRAVAESFNLKVKMIPPMAKGNQLCRRAKGDAEFFNSITGWQGRSNEEKRDAGMIAFFLSK